MTFRTASATISSVSHGPPDSILIVLRQRDGTPIAGEIVGIENTSGPAMAITDGAGQAIIRPGESEVLRLWVAGEECRFRHTLIFDDLFAPACFGDGLTILVLKTSE